MKKPNILIVDDNKAFLELFTALPEAENFHVTPTTSAKRAIQILNDKPVDLIISDLQMPEMSGIELFAAVQDLYPDIPVIFITGYASPDAQVQAEGLGAKNYMFKPFDMDALLQAIREALE